MTRQAAPEDNGKAELDERAGTGLFHRAKHLRGWRKHLHGYACPACGATCHDRGNRDWHDNWHRDDDGAWEEWAEELTEIKNRLMVLEHENGYISKVLGHALTPFVEQENASR